MSFSISLYFSKIPKGQPECPIRTCDGLFFFLTSVNRFCIFFRWTLYPQRYFSRLLVKTRHFYGGASEPLHIRTYRPDGMSHLQVWRLACIDLQEGSQLHYLYRLLITGDLNCPGPDPNNADDRLASVFELFGFAQLVREPTQESNLLDVLACMEGDSFVENVSVDDAGCLSVHQMVLAQLNLGWRRHQPVTFSYRRVREVDFPLFESNLRASSLFINPLASADGYVDQLENVLTMKLGKVAPLKTVTRTSTGKPINRLLSKEAVEAKIMRRKLERQGRNPERKQIDKSMGVAAEKPTA